MTTATRIQAPLPKPDAAPILLRASVISVICTVLVGFVAFYSCDAYFNAARIMLILFVHALVLIPPLAFTLSRYRRHGDLLHPSVVAGIAFIVYHVLFNPIAMTDDNDLANRNLYVDASPDFLITVLISYAVTLTGWVGFWLGHLFLSRKDVPAPTVQKGTPRTTWLFLGIAIGFILIGCFAHMQICGSLKEYVYKMMHFYTRTSTYEEAMKSGGTKWNIMIKFLPVGLIMLAYGLYLIRERLRGPSTPVLLWMLGIAAVSNVFLACATGGRGTYLMVFIYSIFLVNYAYKKYSFKLFVAVLIPLALGSHVLGLARGRTYFGRELELSDILSPTYYTQSTVLYMSNYLGTLTLVREVELSGVSWGKTAFSGIKGLFGGETPTPTYSEMWWRLRGENIDIGPRYGGAGEFYFNFGWPGIIIGCALIGCSVAFLARLYPKPDAEKTLVGGLMTIFAVFSAHFLLMGALHLFPIYFIFYCVPFYFACWALRNRKC